MMIAVYIVVGLVVGVAVGYFIRRNLASSKLAGAEREAEKLLKDSRREAETIVKEARLEAKEELHRVRSEVESDLRDRREELTNAEQRMLQREQAIDSRGAEQDRREQSIRDRDANSQRMSDEINNAHAEAMIQLERISGLSAAQAKEMLLKQTAGSENAGKIVHLTFSLGVCVAGTLRIPLLATGIGNDGPIFTDQGFIVLSQDIGFFCQIFRKPRLILFEPDFRQFLPQ